MQRPELLLPRVRKSNYHSKYLLIAACFLFIVTNNTRSHENEDRLYLKQHHICLLRTQWPFTVQCAGRARDPSLILLLCRVKKRPAVPAVLLSPKSDKRINAHSRTLYCIKSKLFLCNNRWLITHTNIAQCDSLLGLDTNTHPPTPVILLNLANQNQNWIRQSDKKITENKVNVNWNFASLFLRELYRSNHV